MMKRVTSKFLIIIGVVGIFLCCISCRKDAQGRVCEQTAIQWNIDSLSFVSNEDVGGINVDIVRDSMSMQYTSYVECHFVDTTIDIKLKVRENEKIQEGENYQVDKTRMTFVWDAQFVKTRNATLKIEGLRYRESKGGLMDQIFITDAKGSIQYEYFAQELLAWKRGKVTFCLQQK